MKAALIVATLCAALPLSAWSQLKPLAPPPALPAGSGAVDEVKVKQTPDSALAACVVGAVQKAAFARTQKGGTFSYPFRF